MADDELEEKLRAMLSSSYDSDYEQRLVNQAAIAALEWAAAHSHYLLDVQTIRGQIAKLKKGGN